MKERELATVMAALRHYQRGTYSRLELEKIATDGDRFDPLNESEIDELCEKLKWWAGPPPEEVNP